MDYLRSPSGNKGPLQFTVTDQENQKSLVRVIRKRYPSLPASAIYRALRKRDIKVNQSRPRGDQSLVQGDKITIFLLKTDPARPKPQPYVLVHRSGSALIVRKEPGLLVQSGARSDPKEQTLVDLLKKDIHRDCLLCHRLDRQTGGLLLAAIGEKACQSIREQMQQHQVIKRYQCLVLGIPDDGLPVRCHDGKKMLELSGWLEKTAADRRVYIHEKKQAGDIPLITRFSVERVFEDAGPAGEPVSLLTVELVTGRTHQVRAHLAFSGYPVIGDRKYGKNRDNRHFKAGKGKVLSQELWATALHFSPGCHGPLASWAGQIIRIEPDFSWERISNE
jgi:23S rRNA pseudouridine955/2504/2580 synthase